jgi:molybdenum cofactor biosynthesis enzyme MoaA
MPIEVFGAGFTFMARAELVFTEQMAGVGGVFVEEGLPRIHLGDREPLLPDGLERPVSIPARLHDIEEIGLTTNGATLAARAHASRRPPRACHCEHRRAGGGRTWPLARRGTKPD